MSVALGTVRDTTIVPLTFEQIENALADLVLWDQIPCVFNHVTEIARPEGFVISMAFRSVQDGAIVSRDSAGAEFAEAFLIQPNDIFASEQLPLR
jgi:hypothetical protein